MGQHSLDEVRAAAGAPLRRAQGAARFTFIFMAATTISFQTYHSVKTGQMPWPLAVLYGIAAFILAITVLEFARHCGPWVKAGAYVLTAGAMYLSASATGDVTVRAAPPHAQLLFGFLLDGAAILAIYFIFNGPGAAQAVAKVEETIAGLTERADAAARAQAQAEANAARTTEQMRTAHETETATERQAHEQAHARLSGQLAEANETARRQAADRQLAQEQLAVTRTELAALRAGRDTAEAGRRAADTARGEEAARAERQVEGLRVQLDAARAAAARVRTLEAERDAAVARASTAEAEREQALAAQDEAERAAARANAKAERLTRTAAAQGTPKAARAGRTAAAQADRTETMLSPAQAREEAYRMLDGNPDLTGQEIGEPFGFGERWGQLRKEEHERRNGLRAVGGA